MNDIDIIIEATRARCGGWAQEYVAYLKSTLSDAALSALLSDENSPYLAEFGKKVSPQTVTYYRKAAVIANDFPLAVGQASKAGELHKVIAYATTTGKQSSSQVNKWINATITAMRDSEDQGTVLGKAIKDYRAKCKPAPEMPNMDNEGNSDNEDNSDDALVIEVHPQDVADAAMIRILETLATYEGALAAGAKPNEAMTIEMARVFGRLMPKVKVA